MAKRRAEQPLLLLHDSASKKAHGSLLGVDLQLENLPPLPKGASLLAALHGGCRKRAHGMEGTEEAEGLCTKKHGADVLTPQTGGESTQNRHTSPSPPNTKKRGREDCDAPPPKPADKVASGDSNTEDCAYNFFQFWRPPLPALDLSLLDDIDSLTQTEQRSKVKDSAAMET